MTNTELPEAHSSSPYEFSPNVSPESDGPSAEKAATFWLGFAEVYLWPCVKQFDSWEELIGLLETSDLDEMSKCTAQAGKWRRFERAQNWCWAIGRVADRRNQSQETAPGYEFLYTEGFERALLDLYNTTDILDLFTRSCGSTAYGSYNGGLVPDMQFDMLSEPGLEEELPELEQVLLSKSITIAHANFSCLYRDELQLLQQLPSATLLELGKLVGVGPFATAGAQVSTDVDSHTLAPTSAEWDSVIIESVMCLPTETTLIVRQALAVLA